MSQMNDVLANHPFWVVAAIGLAVTVAAWIIIGGELLEKRHGPHMFGPDEP
jgi:hypothetical protein